MGDRISGKKPNRDQRPSRRNFLGPIAAGAAAVSLIKPGTILAATAPIPSIRIPQDFIDSVNQGTRVGSFEGYGMTGAEVFAKACKDEDLAAMFCRPGNYPIIGAIAAAGIPAYGGRSEGPGFTNMIMNIAVAHRARTPLLVLASNTTIAKDDREYFIQTGHQQPTTEGLKEYGSD